jgi:hypothetical protein
MRPVAVFAAAALIACGKPQPQPKQTEPPPSEPAAAADAQPAPPAAAPEPATETPPPADPYGGNVIPPESGAARAGQTADPFLPYDQLTDDADLKAAFDELRRGGPTKALTEKFKAKAALAGPALVKAMWCDNVNVRTHAPTLLSALEPPITPEVGQAFTRSLLFEPVPLARQNVAASLTDYNVPSTADALMEVLEKDGEANVRSHAAYAVGLLKDKRAIPALVKATRDRETWVRLRSVKALGKIGDKSARPAVEASLKDPNPLVRDNAREALGKLR